MYFHMRALLFKKKKKRGQGLNARSTYFRTKRKALTALGNKQPFMTPAISLGEVRFLQHGFRF